MKKINERRSFKIGQFLQPTMTVYRTYMYLFSTSCVACWWEISTTCGNNYQRLQTQLIISTTRGAYQIPNTYQKKKKTYEHDWIPK